MSAPMLYRCILCGTVRRTFIYKQFSTSGTKKNVFVNYVRRLKWVPIPLGVGFAYIGYQQYGHIKEREERKIQSARSPEELVAQSWQVSLYRLLPLKLMSSVWGKVNNWSIPVVLRKPLLKLYIWTFDCNMEEAAVRDLTHYKNLGEFFRRGLKPGVRPIDQNCCLTCPCDGKVLYFGKADRGQVEQVKGITYPIQGFLGPQSWPTGTLKEPLTDTLKEGTDDQSMQNYDTTVVAESQSKKKKLLAVTDKTYQQRLKRNTENEMYHIVVYLAPGDCHRFHSPAQWQVAFRRHFPGDLLSVSPFVARLVKGLFSLNERVVYVGQWQHGFFGFAAVGATNVGSIRIYHDKNLVTNSRKKVQYGTFFDAVFCDCERAGVPMRKGEMFGEFNLGSTIVLLFEAPKKNFQFTVEPGQKIKIGESIGNICEE